MDEIERARQLFFELESQSQRNIDTAVRNFEIASRLAQKIR